MNNYWRQTIIGLLRHAAGTVDSLSERATRTADELSATVSSRSLARAFAILQEAAVRTRDPVYMTGAYYVLQVVPEVQRSELTAAVTGESAGDALSGDDETNAPGGLEVQEGQWRIGLPATGGIVSGRDEVTEEAEVGILELFDRIRRGATLEEALDLFPLIGEEASPCTSSCS